MNTKAKQYWDNVSKKIEEYNNNGKPTVALFCESFYPSFDGVINVSTNYALRMMDRYNVVMIAPRTKDQYIEKEYLTILCKSCDWIHLNSYPIPMPRWDRPFQKVLKKLRIDLVHIHGPFMMGKYGVQYAKRHHIPVIGTFHTQFKKDFLRYVKWEPFTRPLVAYITNTFSKCNEVWTMNNANVDILHSYGYKGVTRIMPNGTDMKHLPIHDELKNKINEEYNLTDKKNVMLFVGRIVENKNIFFIADVLQKLKEKNFPFHMVYVGAGLDLEKLKNRIKKMGLEDQVTFTGKIMDRDKLGAIYLRSDLFLFPSVYDTDGLVKYEAAAYGTPSLLISGSPSSVGTTDNDNAYHSTLDVNAMADRIIEIFSNQQQYEAVSKGAYEKLYCHWTEIVGNAMDAYHQLMNSSLNGNIPHDDKKE